MSRRKTIAFSIILLLVVFVLATRYERVRRDNTDYAVENRFDLGNGRSMLILSDDTPFEVPAWFYEIYENKQMVVPTTYLHGCCGRETGAEILTSCDGNIIGLVSRLRPGVLLVAHDFATSETWPRAQSHDTFDLTLDRGRKLRERLQSDHPDMKLVLSDEVR